MILIIESKPLPKRTTPERHDMVELETERRKSYRLKTSDTKSNQETQSQQTLVLNKEVETKEDMEKTHSCFLKLTTCLDKNKNQPNEESEEVTEEIRDMNLTKQQSILPLLPWWTRYFGLFILAFTNLFIAYYIVLFGSYLKDEEARAWLREFFYVFFPQCIYKPARPNIDNGYYISYLV